MKELNAFVRFKFDYGPTKSFILIESICTFVKKTSICFWNIYEKPITGVHTEYVFFLIQKQSSRDVL